MGRDGVTSWVLWLEGGVSLSPNPQKPFGDPQGLGVPHFSAPSAPTHACCTLGCGRTEGSWSP